MRKFQGCEGTTFPHTPSFNEVASVGRFPTLEKYKTLVFENLKVIKYNIIYYSYEL